MKQAILFAISAIIVGIFLGRLTAPKAPQEDKHYTDSLKRHIVAQERLLNQAVDSARHYKIMADTWYNRFVEVEKSKVIIRTVYRDEIRKIDRLDSAGIDSAFYKRYGSDSIK